MPIRQSKVPLVGITKSPNELSSDDLDSLLKDPKATVEYRIVRATRRLLVTKGLDVSMDDIATEADLGRRTIFRYFPTRDDLIARAFSESLQHFNQQVMSSIATETDFKTWLSSVVESLHQSQIRAGRGMWELAATDDDHLPLPIAKVNKQRRQSRQKLTNAIASEAWQRAGGNGQTPRDIELSFALTISSFAVQSLHNDYKANEKESVDAIASMLFSFITERATQ